MAGHWLVGRQCWARWLPGLLLSPTPGRDGWPTAQVVVLQHRPPFPQVGGVLDENVSCQSLARLPQPLEEGEGCELRSASGWH